MESASPPPPSLNRLAGGKVGAAAGFLTLVVSLLWMGFGPLPIIICVAAILSGHLLANWVAVNANGQLFVPLVAAWLGNGNEGRKSREKQTKTAEEHNMPWKGIQIPSLLNESLESLLDQVIDQYINTWYSSGIGRDKAFLNEIRHQIRFACCQLYQRVEMIDLSSVVSSEIVPSFSLHVHRIVKQLRNLPDQNAPLAVAENKICQQLEDLHYCMGSRQNEVNYLRQVADALVSQLLDESRLSGRAHDDDGPASAASRVWPSHSARHFVRELLVHSIFFPLMDLVADPDTINHLLIISFDSIRMGEQNGVQSPNVEFLKGFSSTLQENIPDSLLQLKLSEILRDSRQFSMFHLYLRDVRGPVNQLSFLAEASRIHDCMQKNDEKPSQIEYDIWQLFRQFVHESSPDRISFEDGISEKFSAAIETHDMDELNRVIEMSYQEVYKRLQSDYVIPFCQSDSFLGYLCGSPPISVVELIDKPLAPRKTSSSDGVLSFNAFRSQFRRLFTVATEGSMEGNEAVEDDFLLDGGSTVVYPEGISGVSSSQANVLEADMEKEVNISHSSKSLPPMAGLDLPSIDISEEGDELNSPPAQFTIADDDASSTCSASAVESVPAEPSLVIDCSRKNINKWKVTVPRIIPTRDTVTGRTIYVYIIEVERFDALEHETKQWSIYRRFTEFYVLENKLVEFHRESLHFAPLPQRKTFVTRNRVFMEQHRLYFASFISSLCKQKLLDRSDLLFAFLTSAEEFRDSLMFSDLNPWKVVKKMPGKLSREKGQHLRPFLLNLLARTLAPVQNVDYREKVDIASESSSLSSLSVAAEGTNPTLYSSIYGNNCIGCRVEESADERENGVWMRSVFDSVLLLAHTVFNPITSWVFNTLASVRLLCRDTLDRAIYCLFTRVERKLCEESNLVSLVQLIQHAIFYAPETLPTQQEKTLREELAKRRVLEYLQDEVPSQLVQCIGREKLRSGAKYIIKVLQFPRLNKQLSYVLLDILVARLLPQKV